MPPPEATRIFETDADGLSDMIRMTLVNLGVPGHILGYPYLTTALSIVVNEPDAIHSMTKVLYPRVAKEHNTTSSRAERSIRHAIEVAYDRCDYEVLSACFGYTIDPNKGKPTNAEFIARVAESIRNQMA